MNQRFERGVQKSFKRTIQSPARKKTRNEEIIMSEEQLVYDVKPLPDKSPADALKEVR